MSEEAWLEAAMTFGGVEPFFGSPDPLALLCGTQKDTFLLKSIFLDHIPLLRGPNKRYTIVS
jgi:hypothetical protein